MIRRLVLVCAALAAFGVMAQTPAPQAGSAPATEPPKLEPEPPAAPYEPQLLRLAEILGALAYLRELCGDPKEGEDMRKQMVALLDAEAGTPGRKARFAGAYNKGFRGFETTYRACTANAELVVERYLAEGQSIAREVASRYGGG